MSFKPVFNPFTGTFDLVKQLDDVVSILAICKATDSVGDCVKIDDNKAGVFYQVEKLDIDADSKPAVGIISSKASATECTVVIYGTITVYTGLNAGTAYLVGTDAKLSPTLGEPGAGITRYVQHMGVALSEDEFMVSPSLARGKKKG